MIVTSGTPAFWAMLLTHKLTGFQANFVVPKQPEDFGGTLLTQLSYFVYIWHNQFILNEN